MKLYFRYFSIHLRSTMQYKVSFFLTLAGQFLTSFSSLLGIWFLFDRFHSVDGFRFEEVLICFSTVLMGFSLAEWFFRGFDAFKGVISNGEFDRIMVQRQHNPHHAYTTGEHTLVAMRSIPSDKVLRLVMLFHDMGKPDVFTTDANGKDHFHGHAAYSAPIAERIMRRLKFDNDTMRQVCTLVRNHSMYPQLTGKDVRRAAHQIGPELFDSFLLVKRADVMAHHPDVIPGKLDYLRELEHIWRDVQLHGDCLSLKDLAVSGKDLIADGMTPGPDIGRVLEHLLELVLDYPEKNEHDVLIKESRRYRAGEEQAGEVEPSPVEE